MNLYRDFFYIDEQSASGLCWKTKVGRGRGIRNHGDSAGCFDKSDGYYRVRFNEKMQYVHNIIWCIANNVESVPFGNVVDHLNGKRADNTINNLTLKERAKNRRNAKMLKTNSSGFTGVYFHTQKQYF
jgi:hypothetical protein